MRLHAVWIPIMAAFGSSQKTIYALMEIFRELTLCSSIGIPFWQNGGITAFALWYRRIWLHFQRSIRCMMWSRGVLREFDSVLCEMTWFCIRLMKSTAMCTFAVFAHAVEIWIYICRSRVRAWSKTKRAARQLPIRKHREERENGIASAVPFSLFSIDAVTFDISKAPMPL